jgi:hypothetical protein
MANMKLAKDILIDRHIPRMIIVIRDLCKKEITCKKIKSKEAQ